MTLQQTFDFSGTGKNAGPTQRRNLVIEAGAGTGKTTAIVAEVLKIMLENEDVSPERIVLVTFTEKAAGEIAERVHAALEELEADPTQWPADSPNPLIVVPADRKDDYRRACEKQLSRIGSLRSQTIHSFCQSLLRQFPIEAGLDPQFKIIEGFERSLLHGQLYDAWIDEETRTNANADVLREWEMLLAYAGYLFQVRAMIFALVERRDLLAEDGYDMGDISLVANDLLQALDIMRSDDGVIGRYVRAHRPPQHEATIDEWIEYLAPIADDIRTTDLPRRNPPVSSALKILRAADAKGKSIHERLTAHRAAIALHALSRRFIDYLDREKRRLGVVDFDDLLHRTAAVLEHDDVVERVRKQYDYIFVDEFQDTDRVQAKIIDRLARDSAGVYVAGKLVIVGDPKQSIYGFRHADPEVYAAMTNRLEQEGAEKRVIVDQYRTDPPLLASMNTMFERLFGTPASDPNVFTPPYHALRARKTDASEPVRITLLEAKGERIAEAESIARWILRNGEDFRRHAILFRRMTIIDDYLDVFDREGVPYVLPPTRMFLDRRAPVDLIAVLRAIAFPFDRGAMISAARTPYFALTDEEIVNPGDEWTSFEASIHAFASHRGTVSELIDRVIATTNIESIYAAAAGGDRSLRHLDHIRAIAFDYDRDAGGSVRQFVDEIARRRSDPDEMEPSLIDDDENAIRILTVHAAKGLEFDTVILPDLGFSAGSSESTELFTVDSPEKSLVMFTPHSLSARFRYSGGEQLKRIAAMREEAESRRLFYVAVTRAKRHVVFVCNDGRLMPNSFAACLKTTLGVDVKNVNADDVNGVDVKVESTSGEAGVQRRRRLRDSALEQQLGEGDIVPLSITPPQVVAPLDSRTIAISRHGSRNRVGGTLLHRVLERWDGDAPVEPLIHSLAAELGVNAETIARVRQRLGVVARSQTMLRIRNAETIGRELVVHFGDREQRIDRLIREGGRDVVVDYKSGTPRDKDKLQVQRYCEAIAQITGRDCAGLLWYIDFDSDEAVDVASGRPAGG